MAGEINRDGASSSANTAQTLSKTTPGTDRRIVMVTVKYSAAPTHGGVTVTLNSGLSSLFDTTLFTGAANDQNNSWIPANDLILTAGDGLDVTAPAGGAGITSHIAIYTEIV